MPAQSGAERLGLKINDMIRSAEGTFPYQAAELLRAARYIATPQVQLRDTAIKCLDHPHFYVRAQAAHLLNRFTLSGKELKKVHNLFISETNVVAKTAFFLLLSQFPEREARKMIEELAASENERLHALYRYLIGVQKT